MFATLLAVVLSLPLQISSVTPSQGAVGTLLSIDGAGFGAKRGSVQLVNPAGGPSVALKVSAWSDTHIDALLGKAVPAGARDVLVLRKPKSLGGLGLAGAFTVRAPSPQTLSASMVLPKTAVTVTGQWFGTKRGKLRVSGVTAKVTAWSDGSIDFVVPPKAAGGVRDVTVASGSGQGTLSGALIVEGAAIPGGPDVLSVVADGQLWQASTAWRVLGAQGGSLVLGASFDHGRSLRISLPADVAISALPLTVLGDPAGYVAWNQGAPLVDSSATAWTTQGQGDDYHVNLWSAGPGRVVGTVTGTLHRVSGGGAPETLVLDAGTFLITLPAP